MSLINFNELPQDKPGMGAIIPTGQYIGKIEKAEMKVGKNENNPPYLNLQIEVTDPESNTVMGRIWAILTESEKNLPRYQLRRFIEALGLTNLQSFELKDLTKIVVNKKLLVDITPEERTDGKPPQKSVVDISGEIFYPYKEDDNLPFDAAPVVETATTTAAEY